MTEALVAINEMSVTTWLIAIGAVFLFISVAGSVKLGGKLAVLNIDPGKWGRIAAFLIGSINLFAGVSIEISIQVSGIQDYDEVVVASADFDMVYAEETSEPTVVEYYQEQQIAMVDGPPAASARSVASAGPEVEPEVAFEPVQATCDPSFFRGRWGTTWGDLIFVEVTESGEMIAEYGKDNGTIYLLNDSEDCSEFQGVWVEDSSNHDCEEPIVDEDDRTHWGGMYVEFVTSPPAFKAYWDYCGNPDLASPDIWAGRKKPKAKK